MKAINIWTWSTVAMVFLAGLSPVAAQQGRGRGGAAAERFGWLSDLEKGKAEARRLDKPLMVVLRCGP